MLDITSEILVHLCHKVTLEKRYRSFVRVRNPTLPRPYSPLGLGSNETWHDTPDGRVNIGYSRNTSGVSDLPHERAARVG